MTTSKYIAFPAAGGLLMAAAVLLLTGPQVIRADEEKASLTFEQHVRPILKAHCFHCHGEGERLNGGLDLRLKRLIVKGGDSGPSLVAGEPDASYLYERVRLGEMPPEDVETKLTEKEVALIGKWIAAGAPTAREEPVEIGSGWFATEEERQFWVFQPVSRPELPQVRNADRVRSPVDRFLLARLEANGLSYSSDADKQTLLRRLYFDLLGLPPAPDEVARFLEDESADAYERLVDRVLGSSHYGERWGRHWLDVAGYADSEGYTDEDVVRPDAFRFRDYVIRSLNADKPFHQFVQEQLAGDEMVRPPYGELGEADLDKLVATGFLRMAPDGTGSAGIDENVARNEVVAKTIEIVSTSLLGLTVGCAQCHNHRYDPIPQTDYYRLRAIFEPALDWRSWQTAVQRKVSLYTDRDRQLAAQVEEEAKQVEQERLKKQEEFIAATFERELSKLDDDLKERIREARNTPQAKRSAAQKKLLMDHPSVNVTAGSLYLYDGKAADELKKLSEKAAQIRETKPVERFVRALTEPAGKKPPETFLFTRGDHEQPGERLLPGELTILAADSPRADVPVDDPALPTTGRRLAYARWLTSGDHPLTARVLVNRVWMHHFGRGLVDTPGDFGFLGDRPTHPELLDWLAVQFVEGGWSLKSLHRVIVTSTAYRQSSGSNPAGQTADEENSLYWRMPVRRLEAEALRDAMLATSGTLNLKAYGPAVPVMADTVGQFVVGIENLNAGRPGDVIPMHGEEYRRSVYVQARRSRVLSVLEAFDAPRMDPNCPSRAASTVATQSLMLMNSDFVTRHAELLAERVRAEAGSDQAAQICRAWMLAYARAPAADELAAAERFLEQQTTQYQQQTAETPQRRAKAPGKLAPSDRALASFCHALLSSNEFLYVE